MKFLSMARHGSDIEEISDIGEVLIQVPNLDKAQKHNYM